MSSIESRPDAPWIKRNKFGVVFTTSEELLKLEDVDIKTERSNEAEKHQKTNGQLHLDDELMKYGNRQNDKPEIIKK